MSGSLRLVSILALCLATLSVGMVSAQAPPYLLITNEYDDARAGVARYSLGGTYLGQLSTLRSSGIAVMGPAAYVSRVGSGAIYRYALDGTLLGTFNTTGGSSQDIATLGGNLYIGDWDSYVRVYTPGGALLDYRAFGGGVVGVCGDGGSNMYVADWSGAVSKWDVSTSTSTVLYNLGTQAYGVALNGSDVYASAIYQGAIYKNGVAWQTGLGSEIRGLLAHGGILYAAKYSSHQILRFDLGTGASLGPIGGSVPELWNPMNIDVVVPEPAALTTLLLGSAFAAGFIRRPKRRA